MFEVFDGKYTSSVFNLRYTIHKVHVKTLSTERNCKSFLNLILELTKISVKFCKIFHPGILI